MQTELLQIDANEPDASVLARAADVLKRGGLVAFPTETVYGLGANALDAAAVARIYVAKGRPARNPLIVHVLDSTQARELAEWDDRAEKLAARFWPGPLTLVLRKKYVVPEIVTAGGDTVALRAPAHAVARGLIAAAGMPIAAPSANRSSAVSATRAEHVLRMLDGRIDMILDGGATAGGIESTVVSLVGERPKLLRPGLLPAAEIEAAIGALASVGDSASSDAPLPSPGMLSRHYAPAGQLELTPDDGYARALALVRSGHRVGWLRLAGVEGESRAFGLDRLKAFVLPRDPAGYGARLYDVLHELDAWSADRIVVESPPREAAWGAIHDRLERAATCEP
jgi:L-threonylcarbamoyladenylate synthase